MPRTSGATGSAPSGSQEDRSALVLSPAPLPQRRADAPPLRARVLSGYGTMRQEAHRIASDPARLQSAVDSLQSSVYSRNSATPRMDRLRLWADISCAHSPDADPFFLTPDLIFKTVAVLNAAGYRSAITILSGAKQQHIEDGH
eukprot:1761214-Alexandrium_andersonii.AAC.1